jgi:hypothetical protein
MLTINGKLARVKTCNGQFFIGVRKISNCNLYPQISTYQEGFA